MGTRLSTLNLGSEVSLQRASHNAFLFSFWKRSRGSNTESKSANDWPAFPQFISKFRLTDQVTIN